MDEIPFVQPLTKANLRKLEGKKPDSTAPSTYSDYLPADKLERAKRRVHHFLWDLGGIGPEGRRIREVEDVFIAGSISVRYRGNAVPEPDLQDPNFWETKLQYLENKYRPTIDFMTAKNGVYLEMMDLLHLCGREGRNALANYELYIAGEHDVRYRGDRNPEPDLQDTAYWQDQRQYLQNKFWEIRKQEYPPRPSSTVRAPNTEEKEELAEMERTEEYIRSWADRKKGIELWVDGTQNTEGSLAEPHTPVSHVSSDERTSVSGIEDSVGRPARITRSGRWRLAHLGVYDRMLALWHLGGEGREIVKNDELRVMGRFDIRYKRGRGPKPDLQDPGYWEAKLEYFTDKLVSLLRARHAEDESSLLPWLGLHDENRDTLPIPSPASDVPSTAFSPIPNLRPSSASIRTSQIRKAKELLYETLTEDFFQNEGRGILENDEIYIAGKYDVRCRQKSGPVPDLQDPEYWRQKNAYFRLQHTKYTQSLETATSQPSSPPIQTLEQPKSLAPRTTQNSHQSKQTKKHTRASTTRSVMREIAPVQNSINQNSGTTPPLEIINRQVIDSPGSSKRKRDSRLDDTSKAENHLLHPAKRNRLCAGQASETITAAIEATPTTVPQHRRKQRKTYEKTRSSRRIAGQLPEFGLLPRRGEEPLPYEAPAQVPSNARVASRLSKKPKVISEVKPRGISKSTQAKAARPRRSKRS
ncbi:hypothetical protein F5Y10DRAFT_294346 [Nemania abortiva]|nr:hypothetical protein F5Y10DRAFT_294346 [Nemania abortiva]